MTNREPGRRFCPGSDPVTLTDRAAPVRPGLSERRRRRPQRRRSGHTGHSVLTTTTMSQRCCSSPAGHDNAGPPSRPARQRGASVVADRRPPSNSHGPPMRPAPASIRPDNHTRPRRTHPQPPDHRNQHGKRHRTRTPRDRPSSLPRPPARSTRTHSGGTPAAKQPAWQHPPEPQPKDTVTGKPTPTSAPRRSPPPGKPYAPDRGPPVPTPGRIAGYRPKRDLAGERRSGGPRRRSTSAGRKARAIGWGP